MKRREQTAVLNFLCSLGNDTSPEAMHAAYENARRDAKSYKWSDEALEECIKGIGRHFEWRRNPTDPFARCR